MTTIAQLKRIIASEVKRRRDIAGFNGAHHDGGAGELEMQLRFFEHGIRYVNSNCQRMPSEWADMVKQAERETDPEYQEYLRLQRKFGVRS